MTMDQDKLFARLDDFHIETPSWGYADTGTRFGKFLQPAAASTIDEKLADAGTVRARLQRLRGRRRRCVLLAADALGEEASEAGLRVVQTPYQAPNANAYAERFVRSIKEECLSRVIPVGERHFRRTIAEFVAHYHRERNHQGLENELIEGAPAMEEQVGRIRRRQRLGRLLNYYYRAA